MSAGIGVSTDDMSYGDADSWGGPDNGIEIVSQLGGDIVKKTSATIPEDVYLFIIVVGAIAALWFLAGVVFKDVIQ